jgi:hypothetical protein
VRAGLIDRFGSIDPNEGGITEPTNVNLDYQWTTTDAHRVSVNAFASYYALSLFNDFTFFLSDPDNGDMINQRDRRWVAGLDAQYEWTSQPLGMSLTSTAGVQYRLDTPRVVLASAIQRHPINRVVDADIVEQSFSPFVKLDLAPVDKVRLVTGARGDVFTFDVHERVNAADVPRSGTRTQARPSVKANRVLGPWARTELYANFGTGFHSNDARAVVADPKVDALPTATGTRPGSGRASCRGWSSSRPTGSSTSTASWCSSAMRARRRRAEGATGKVWRRGSRFACSTGSPSRATSRTPCERNSSTPACRFPWRRS